MMWWKYQQLRSGNLKTRLATVAKLADSNHADSIPPLVFALKDKTAEIRNSAVLALCQFQDPRVFEPLIKLLQDPVPAVRATVVQVLGRMPSANPGKDMAGLLQDADVTVRINVVRSLDKLGWIPEDDAARAAYIFASGNLEEVAELGGGGIEQLVEMLNNGTPEKQLSAVKALAQISDPSIPGHLRQALKHKASLVRIVALEALEQLADPSAYEAVEQLFKDEASNVRAAAVVAAAKCDGSRAVPAVVAMLTDTSWEVRFQAVKTLGKLGDVSAVDALCRSLWDKDHDVRENAVHALGKIGDPRAVPSLVLATLDLESFVRTAANNALSRLDRDWKKSAAARSVLPQIKAARNHREYWISQSAERLLEQMQPDSADTITTRPARPTAPPAAANPSPQANVRHPAFAMLTDLLRDSDRDLRRAAAQALGDVRETEAVTHLLTASQDQDPFVRQAAENALAGLN